MLQRCIKFAIYWLELSPLWYLSSNIESESIFSTLKLNQSRSIRINFWLSFFFFFRHVCISYWSRDIERPSLSDGDRGEICHPRSLIFWSYSMASLPPILCHGFELFLEGVFVAMIYALIISFSRLRSHWLFTVWHLRSFWVLPCFALLVCILIPNSTLFPGLFRWRGNGRGNWYRLM